MGNKDVYSMKLHDVIYINNGDAKVTRVAGGWVYVFLRLDHDTMTSVFVRFDNEFQKSEAAGE